MFNSVYTKLNCNTPFVKKSTGKPFLCAEVVELCKSQYEAGDSCQTDTCIVEIQGFGLAYDLNNIGYL